MTAQSIPPIRHGAGGIITEQLDVLPSESKPLGVDETGKYVLLEPFDDSDLLTELDAKADASALEAHTANTDNPHSTTLAQLGAGITDTVTFGRVNADDMRVSSTTGFKSNNLGLICVGSFLPGNFAGTLITNTTDLGSSGNSWRNVYIGSIAYVAGSIVLGSDVSGGPRIKRSGTVVQLRNNADNAFADLETGALTTSGNHVFTGANPTITFPSFGSLNTTDIATIDGGTNRYFLRLKASGRNLDWQGNGALVVDGQMMLAQRYIRSLFDGTSPMLKWNAGVLAVRNPLDDADSGFSAGAATFTGQLSVGTGASSTLVTTSNSGAGYFDMSASGAVLRFFGSQITCYGSFNPQSGMNVTGTVQHVEQTFTPTGTTQTINLSSGNLSRLSLGSTTGNITLTLTVPANTASGRITIIQHATTARGIAIAVSSGTIVWFSTTPAWSSQTTGKKTNLFWTKSGTELHLSAVEEV